MPKTPDYLVKKKPLFVGQAPSRSGQRNKDERNVESRAFGGSSRSGKRLAELVGIDHRKLLELVETVNLNDGYSARSCGKGDDFNVAEGRAKAANLDVESRAIVMFGRKVAECFDKGDMRWLEERCENGTLWVLLPHPSGINLWWNNAENKRKASLHLKKLISSLNVGG